MKAARLSFDGMTRKLRRTLGWLACALGLSLASQLVQAGSPCVSMSEGAGDGPYATLPSPCAMPGDADDRCVVSAPRVHAGATAPAPPGVSSPVGALGCRPAIARARAEQAFFSGPAPGSRPPLHVLFHRYLI